mmetsp:Transcript_88065/g.284355  ORF Transcript_88065/g.284355 Transcript_88065/m.284355 type:complete len:202 (-) Transcript_88065:108-713(-)
MEVQNLPRATACGASGATVSDPHDPAESVVAAVPAILTSVVGTAAWTCAVFAVGEAALTGALFRAGETIMKRRYCAWCSCMDTGEADGTHVAAPGVPQATGEAPTAVITCLRLANGLPRAVACCCCCCCCCCCLCCTGEVAAALTPNVGLTMAGRADNISGGGAPARKLNGPTTVVATVWRRGGPAEVLGSCCCCRACGCG